MNHFQSPKIWSHVTLTSVGVLIKGMTYYLVVYIIWRPLEISIWNVIFEGSAGIHVGCLIMTNYDQCSERPGCIIWADVGRDRLLLHYRWKQRHAGLLKKLYSDPRVFGMLALIISNAMWHDKWQQIALLILLFRQANDYIYKPT